MKTFVLGITLLAILSCKKNEDKIRYSPKPQTDTIVHTDTTYEYEQRTGTSGNYEYTYDVIGTDSQGNEVTGTVEVEGKTGIGNLSDREGITFNVEVEWIDYGILNATDNHGNQYQLEISK
jgi:hypothetical protein